MSTDTVYLDIETRSTVDLRKTGVYIYAEDPSTDVLLACWVLNRDARINTWFRGEPVPAELHDAIRSGARVVAHNFTFERILHRHVLGPRYGWPEIPMRQWDCTMARARAAGLQGSLDGALKGMEAKFGKDAAGYRLMLQMCKPRRIENDGTVVWWEDEERMQRLAAYCAGDVVGERWLDLRLPQLSPFEREVWLATERLNDRGVPLDTDFLDAAIAVSEETSKALDKAMARETGGAVPKATNVTRLRDWILSKGVRIAPPKIETEGGEVEDAVDDSGEGEDDVPELRRGDVERLLAQDREAQQELREEGTLPDDVREALEIRLEAGKSSVKKVQAMLRRVQPDRRVRGMLSYYGAATGRWSAAGSGIQLQNLPRDGVKNWRHCRELLGLGSEAVEAFEGPPLGMLSRMLRGALLAPDGETFHFADLSSVEARGVAWMAGQDDLVEAFRSGAPMYERMAARVFGMTEAEVIALGKDSYHRFIGKGLVLGAGYSMGGPKFAATCARAGRVVGLELAKQAIATYRETFPLIPRFWYKLDDAAIDCVKEGKPKVYRGVSFHLFKRWLVMTLPSGSEIFYRNPRINKEANYGTRDQLAYDGTDSKTKRWGEQWTYGGRLTENAVQRICRDLIAHSLLKTEEAGYEPVLLVHDETLTLKKAGTGSHEELVRIMTELPAWAKGFPLAAEGKTARRYSK